MQFLTAGESHGRCLVGILEGMPAGLAISESEIAVDLKRRQHGYGRGDRMKIEQDHAQILTGVRYGLTMGSPIALLIENRDWPNWTSRMRADTPPDGERVPPLTSPRPGHADWAGSLKYRHSDIRNVIERSSARETTTRVALAAIGRKFFRELGIEVGSHVIQIGPVAANCSQGERTVSELNRDADASPVRCLDAAAGARMIEAIDDAKAQGDTLGGVFEVVVTGLPVGIGSFSHYDKRLDGILAGAMMSIHAMKAVGFGMGFDVASHPGSEVHDRLFPGELREVERQTNNAGGTEGGMTNGEPLRIRVAMKPLSTLGRPLDSVDLATGEPVTALRERSDVCAVPAAAIVGEAMALLALVNPFLEKFGGDSMDEIRAHLNATPPSPWV
ncbi:chorismate synthase [candidate division KSB1 bacterium]|nr:chorismate synthase [candidate division KSB1 bacterium]